jgi:hypothetical protein
MRENKKKHINANNGRQTEEMIQIYTKLKWPMGSWLKCKYYPDIRLDGLRKTTRNLIQDSRLAG